MNERKSKIHGNFEKSGGNEIITMRHKLKSWKRGRKKERKREQNEKWRKATSSSFVYPGPFTL